MGIKLDDKQLKKLNNREYRTLQLNTANDEESKDSFIVEGYATTFNQQYRLYGDDDYEVREVVDQHAFDECDMNDVIFQFDHEGKVYARTRNNTLQLSIDEHGLKVRADLGGTEIGRNLYEEIKGGYIDRMSFGFTVTEEDVLWTTEDDKDVGIRTIKKIGKLYDVSAVSIPANDYTSISSRSYFNGVIEGKQAERLAREERNRQIEILKLKLKLMED